MHAFPPQNKPLILVKKNIQVFWLSFSVYKYISSPTGEYGTYECIFSHLTPHLAARD